MRNCSPHAPASNPTDTKLSQHTHTSSPTGTKLSQHTHTSSPTGTKLSQHAQNCPFQPVLPEQGELCTAATTTTPSRENFVPLAPPRSRAGRTLYRAQCQTRYKTPPTHPHQQPNRYKTLPTHPHQQPNRYKTLPTHPKRPISASFARAGRTLYRSHHQEAEQGELCTAPSAKPGTKLSQRPVLQRFREKVRPAHPKTAFFASFAPAGRIFSRTSKQQATQGELFRALGIEQGVLTKVVCADI